MTMRLRPTQLRQVSPVAPVSRVSRQQVGRCQLNVGLNWHDKPEHEPKHERRPSPYPLPIRWGEGEDEKRSRCMAIHLQRAEVYDNHGLPQERPPLTPALSPQRGEGDHAEECLLMKRRGEAAFSLLEVLIAIGIFAIVSFAILEIVVTGMGAARSLQIRHADVGMLAAELVATNACLEEGIESGDFGDFYPHARWERAITEVGSNGLLQVDFVVFEKIGRKEAPSTVSILLYNPCSRGKFGAPK